MAALLPRHNGMAQRRHSWLRIVMSWKIIVPLLCLWYYLSHHSTESAPVTVWNTAAPPPLAVPSRYAHSPQAHIARADYEHSDEQRKILPNAHGALVSPEHEQITFERPPPEDIEHSQHRDKVTEQVLFDSQESPESSLSSKAFPGYSEYTRLVQKAERLPDVVMIPFEEAVSSDVLQGWEYEWVANGSYDVEKWNAMREPKIDFVYEWVNGSEKAFQRTKRPYELNSTLNDAAGLWLASHGSNRYRDWNELLFSLRSLEKHAPFRNRIQILVNAVVDEELDATLKQEPAWLNRQAKESGSVQILSQEDFFEDDKQGCLPTFNSLTIENQIHHTPSEVDRVFALSDDMLLGKPHAASDIYSPLYGPMIGFKSNSYSTMTRPNKADAERFGEKPWLIYTSWLLNRRFGPRKRKGMAHFGHSISRKVMGETMRSFPGPELQSACSRFRGDFGFQLYSWYATFHYTLERHREVLLWSYLMVRADLDGDGYLSWTERKAVLADIIQGHENEGKSSFRARNFYTLPDVLEDAGLEPPAVNFDILWTSLDGPVMIKDIDCFDFDINDCIAPGFTARMDTEGTRNPAFSTAAMFDRVSRQHPECGDCLIKILLHRVHKGLSPLMPDPTTQSNEYDIVTKALMRYQYVVHEPDGLFVMVTDTEQVDSTLIKRFKKKDKLVGQLCLNDDVSTEDETELRDLRDALNEMYLQLFPHPSSFEDTGARG